jgi:hypothetical protein
MKTICTILGSLAFIGLTAERADGSLPIWWTLLCLAILILCARVLFPPERKTGK